MIAERKCIIVRNLLANPSYPNQALDIFRKSFFRYILRPLADDKGKSRVTHRLSDTIHTFVTLPCVLGTTLPLAEVVIVTCE